MLVETTRIRGGELRLDRDTPAIAILNAKSLADTSQINLFQLNQFLLGKDFSRKELPEITQMLAREDTEALYLFNEQKATVDGIVAGEYIKYNNDSILSLRIFAFNWGVLNKQKASELLQKLKTKTKERDDNCTWIAMTAKLADHGDMALIKSIPWSEGAISIKNEETGTVTVFEPTT